ncbi:MAG: helix-turn-helix domain-containing protein [Bifidobacteriaceae bacterium]|nr:helix-turn-helix domain-containing protein [Bifidobacteriaceae bacterium]
MAEDSVEMLTRRMERLAEDHDRLLVSLRDMRRAKGLTQAQVAERMGVTQPTVAQLERYDANPTLSTLRRYALAVGASTSTSVSDAEAPAAEQLLGVWVATLPHFDSGGVGYSRVAVVSAVHPDSIVFPQGPREPARSPRMIAEAAG